MKLTARRDCVDASTKRCAVRAQPRRRLLRLGVVGRSLRLEHARHAVAHRKAQAVGMTRQPLEPAIPAHGRDRPLADRAHEQFEQAGIDRHRAVLRRRASVWFSDGARLAAAPINASISAGGSAKSKGATHVRCAIGAAGSIFTASFSVTNSCSPSRRRAGGASRDGRAGAAVRTRGRQRAASRRSAAATRCPRRRRCGALRNASRLPRFGLAPLRPIEQAHGTAQSPLRRPAGPRRGRAIGVVEHHAARGHVRPTAARATAPQAAAGRCRSRARRSRSVARRARGGGAASPSSAITMSTCGCRDSSVRAASMRRACDEHRARGAPRDQQRLVTDVGCARSRRDLGDAAFARVRSRARPPPVSSRVRARQARARSSWAFCLHRPPRGCPRRHRHWQASAGVPSLGREPPARVERGQAAAALARPRSAACATTAARARTLSQGNRRAASCPRALPRVSRPRLFVRRRSRAPSPHAGRRQAR